MINWATLYWHSTILASSLWKWIKRFYLLLQDRAKIHLGITLSLSLSLSLSLWTSLLAWCPWQKETWWFITLIMHLYTYKRHSIPVASFHSAFQKYAQSLVLFGFAVVLHQLILPTWSVKIGIALKKQPWKICLIRYYKSMKFVI